MIKYLTYIFLFLMVLSACSKKEENLEVSIKKTVEQWMTALQKRDSKTINRLLDPNTRTSLENHLKLYFQTLLDLNQDSKESKRIKEIIELQGEKFIEAFFSWQDNVSPSHSLKYSISEIRTGNSESSVKILINNEIKVIPLVKGKEQWYVKASNLGN